jgi:hypothetical protein
MYNHYDHLPGIHPPSDDFAVLAARIGGQELEDQGADDFFVPVWLNSEIPNR